MDSPFNRRQLLSRAACGFGSVALAGLLGKQGLFAQGRPGGAGRSHGAVRSSLAPKLPHFAPRVKRVIFLFMQGGPSQIDTFDYKPRLFESDGKDIDFVGVRFDTFGKASKRKLMRPLWNFKRHGECGQPVSELFPHVARHVDQLCFLHGLQTEGVAHGPSTLFLHTGATNLVRPSMGSWITYGLGTENENLPGFVTISPSATKGGPRNYANGFLPTVYQGTTIGAAGFPARGASLPHLKDLRGSAASEQRDFRLLQALNRAQLDVSGPDDRLEATIESFELAYRMQMHAPGVLDLANETRETLELYGIDEGPTDDFGRQCLMARRLAEAGVRYIQVNYADESVTPRWDQHSDMPKHAVHALATDKPVAGLLADLKRRGLLDDTLLWWGGEFGRTPFAQGRNGRDHNPRGFTVWLAGGGVRPGISYGATDDIGHRAVEGKVHMHDLHATILHLLGLDHEDLTFRHAGRDFRLTDVAGRVVDEILL